MLRIFVLLAVPACLCGLADAQATQFEGKRIIDIQFSEVQPLDPADLAKAQPLKIGQPLRMSEVAQAVDGLFATGRFDDIAVEAEASGNGVAIRFVTKNAWFVGGVSVQGDVGTPPNRGQVGTTAQLSLGTPFHEDDVARGVENIKRLMEANGLYEAQVTSSVERSSNAQEVFVTLYVEKGKRAKYGMPTVEGDTKLSNDTILRVTGWRLPIIHWWRQVSDAKTRKGVHGLLEKYQKQDRLTARVELKKLDYDAQRRRVHPRLTVNTGPKVVVTAVEAKMSKRLLKRYVPVFQENTVDNDLLVEGKRNIHDYLQSQGYYDVDVDFRVLPPRNDVETIEYIISRGQRYRLVHVAISGNNYFDEDDIRERMFMQPASLRMRRGRYSEAFRRKDEENIADLYRANGFRDVKVASIVDHDYRNNEGDIAVTVKIEEGPQWFVDSLAMRGVNQLNADQLRPQLASLAGQPFAEVNLASDRDTLLTYYYAHGFPTANLSTSWQVNGQPHHVNVTYTVTEGDRQYVRKVITSGLHTTRPSVVEKQIKLKPGDPLSPIEQTEIQKTFYDLGIFARVDTAIENPDGQTDHKYVLYNFEEANRYDLSLGVGAQVARFGTPSTTDLSAPAGTPGFSPQFTATLTRLNFRGMGHTISLRGSYSSLEKLVSLSYLQPRFQNTEGRNLTYATLFDQSLDIRTFASKRIEGSVQLTQKFSRSLTGLFRFSYRRVSVSDVVIPVLLVPQLVQPVRLGILSANFIQDRRDNPADPHHGIYNTVDIGVTGRFLGSERSFARMLLRNATYYKLTRNVVLARQTQFGVIRPFSAPAGVGDQESVPLPERFFGGGADSLRAFPYNEAGPRDTGAALVPGGPTSAPTGFPLGGNALFFNNIELRFPFIGDNIQGVFFHDMGNVYSSVTNMSFRFRQKNLQDFDYAVHAVGFGLRYKTPIGPIRGDLAYSINPPSFVGFNGTPVQLLQCNPSLPASALPSFCQPVQQSISHFQFFFSIGQTF